MVHCYVSRPVVFAKWCSFVVRMVANGSGVGWLRH